MPPEIALHVMRNEEMPLTGEAIRMMNLVDDISTTLRRILALSPTLSAEERKRVSEYLRASTPNAEQVLAALEVK
jgi:RPA family protein